MRRAALVGTYRTRERFRLVLNGERHSPCMAAGAGMGRRVTGEVYAVDQKGLERMDLLERIDLPDGYRRYRIVVDAVDDAPDPSLEVLVYLKEPAFIDDPRTGNLAAYTPAQARLYRNRPSMPTNGDQPHG
jgi:gamma-glutamylaminecyclotransferase